MAAMWAERVAAWQSSGESMRTFALRHEWRPRQLAWWARRITKLPTCPNNQLDLLPPLAQPKQN
jgi:hypothetical protein